ncbi:hypothetical protein V2O64_13360 [Verrucomicrobiaceae bacterium 227]
MPLLLLFLLLGPLRAGPPKVRIITRGFESPEANISAVLASTTRELWKHFPDYKLEPIVVVRGEQGPITLFERNDQGEIVVKLDTHKTYWSQYAYQWAHEFGHILAGFRNDGRENKWFEESLCELASLYAMRRMSESWEHDPPYSNWKDYRHSLKDYVDKIINSREKLTPGDLAGYYRKHRETLRKSSTERALNSTMALALLPLFEKEPSHWGALRYLNVTPAKEGLSLKDYFAKWHKDAPAKHQPFIHEIARHFGAIKA